MLVAQPAVLSVASVQNENDQGGFGNNVNIRMVIIETKRMRMKVITKLTRKPGASPRNHI